ncbi:hypothetical protein PFICI_04899 [Pestalotiopsis fici W106-1]|uniref:Uncharacterized protein n=1 Tax=Pestalotiopsis fici (strain W106-1 / CGMCC3.15140) TaxID=1229662 RepID=W3XA91_PESFW|nr:uncharacterized protein PFICI_04899 [Pestalotiopsis fici W106-1]ETS83023.1 hypothetical protein PFICI_04899 [Pestalotiopsis fici W106-1]
MTVTELAHFHSKSGDLTPALRDLIRWAVDAQDKWCAENLSSTTQYMSDGNEARGVGFDHVHIDFQQIEDPAVVLLTAHWESVPQHVEWMGSDINKQAIPPLSEQVDMSKLLIFHVDDVDAISPEILRAPVVSVSRYLVPKNRKQTVGQSMKEIYSRDNARPISKSGWRIEKDEAMERDGVEEHVIVSGAESIQNLKEIEATLFKAVFSGCGQEIRHYKRIF